MTSQADMQATEPQYNPAWLGFWSEVFRLHRELTTRREKKAKEQADTSKPESNTNKKAASLYGNAA